MNLADCLAFAACCSGGRAVLKGEEALALKGEDSQVSQSSELARADDPKIKAVVDAASALLPGGQMTEWQRSWCTSENVAIYLRGRDGRVPAAAQILSQALLWREEFKDVLSGARQPEWQSDFRVLTRCDSGHPVIYMCYRHHLPPWNARAIVEHGAVVLEAAVRSMRNGATKFDVLIDCYGFNATHLDCRSLFGIVKMIQQPFRDRLRTCFLVGAPSAFSFVYRFGSKLMKEETRRKTAFATTDEVLAHVLQVGGPRAAETLKHVLSLNRAGTSCLPGDVPGERRLPSDLPDAARPAATAISAAAAAPTPAGRPRRPDAAGRPLRADPPEAPGAAGARGPLCCRRRQRGDSRRGLCKLLNRLRQMAVAFA